MLRPLWPSSHSGPLIDQLIRPRLTEVVLVTEGLSPEVLALPNGGQHSCTRQIPKSHGEEANRGQRQQLIYFEPPAPVVLRG